MKRWLLAVLVWALPHASLAQDGGSAPVGSLRPDAGPEADSFLPAPGSTTASVEPFTTATPAPEARVYGAVRGESSVDTRFDSPRGAPLSEDVAEGRLRATLGLDARLSARLRVAVEGRAQLWVGTQRSFDRARGLFEPLLGDAFLDVYTAGADWRLGNQRIALGANAAMAPADALNPRDLRESLLSAEPEDLTLPVFAVRAQGELGKVAWLAAYVPFFSPHRYTLFGRDEALLQPALAPGFDEKRLDPSVQDLVEERLLETKRPPPLLGDLALRLVSPGRVKLGVSWVWMNEKLPAVVVDRELALFLASQARGKTADPATVTSLLNRFQAGEALFTGTFGRAHLFSVEGSALLGPGQLDVDVTWSPRQTYFDAALAPLSKPSLTWVVGYSQATDSPLVWAVQYLGLAVPDVGQREQLMLIEPATSLGAARTAFLHLVVGHVAYPVWRDRFGLSLRAAFEPIQRSFALAPRVTWQGREGLKVWLAGELLEGPQWSPFGYFGRNNKLLLGASLELF